VEKRQGGVERNVATFQNAEESSWVLKLGGGRGIWGGEVEG